MKKIETSDFLSLSFIFLIGFIDFFYKNEFVFGTAVIFIGIVLSIITLFKSGK